MRSVLNNKALLLVVAILLLSNIAMLFFFVWRKEPPNRGYHGERQRSPVAQFLEQKVGFDKQQMEAYDKMRQQHRQKMKPLFEDARLSKVRFYALLNDTAVDDTEFRKVSSAVGDKQEAIDLQAFRNFKELRTICKPGQQLMYDSLIAGVIGNMWFPARKGNTHQKQDSLTKNR